MNIHNPVRIAFTAATLIAALTTAATATEVPQVHVKYQDLNLNTTAGAEVLYRRIHAAADQVCGNFGTRDLALLDSTKACAKNAIAQAVAQVDNPQLTRLYAGKADLTAAMRIAAR